jgi:hypothetical protein
MAVTISTSARDILANGIVDLLDNGGAGTLEIVSAGGLKVLAELGLSNPSFGNSSTGVATANAISDETSAIQTGTAALFKLRAGTGEIVLSGTVGTSGEDINLNTVSITEGDTISITAMTVTMPAS